jgi:hypothetical protein
MFRKIWEETDRKNRYGRFAEEVGQIDAGGNSDGHRGSYEVHACNRSERKGSQGWCAIH